MLLCTQQIFQWRAEPVRNIQIKNEQEKTVAQDYKTAYVDNLRRIGLLPAESEARDQEKEVNRIFPVEHKAER